MGDHGAARSAWINFLTDYGLEDNFVGVCRGVIARIAPEARVIDVTHAVPPGDVAHGAEVLRQSVEYLPRGVHLVVVDPGVGTARRPVALVAEDGVFVGPDNGVLVPAAELLGGVREAYELTDPRFHLRRVFRTFHGRDVFAPVAAHLASGVPPAELGPRIDPGSLTRLPEPPRRREGDVLHGSVVLQDRYGNLQTSLDAGLLAGERHGGRFTLRAGGIAMTIPYVETFGSVGRGEVMAYLDAADRLAFAVNLGSAAGLLGLREGDTFELEVPPPGRRG